jgi:uncharacterized protein (PEP-CTERM system associated)
MRLALGAFLLVFPAVGARAQLIPADASLDLAGPGISEPTDFGAAIPSGESAGVGALPAAPSWYGDGVLDTGRPPAGVPAAPWRLVPSLEGQVGATDNIRNERTDRRGDVFVRLGPRLTLLADTPTVRGAATYAPRMTHYFIDESQSRVDHLFNGQLFVTLVPDLFFVDMRGSGDARSVFGEFVGFEDTSTDRRDRVQTTNLSIRPYFEHHFGGDATVRVGYRVRQSSISGRDAFAEGSNRPFFSGQDFVAHEGFAAIRSGVDWGPFAYFAQTSNTVYEGSGIYEDAHRYIHTLQLRYSLTRELAAVVDGGWQDERYGGQRPFVIQDPIWRFAPAPDSLLVVRYGERDGFTSFSLNASLPIGVRTRLFARYNEGITSSALENSDLLNTVRVDAQGNAVDSSSGLPVSVTGGSPLLASQSGLFKVRRAIAAASQSWTRDTFTLSLFHEEREPVLAAPGGIAFAQESTSASLGWSRALAPGTNISSSVRYGISQSDFAGRGTNIGFQTVLARALTPTLTGSVRYAVRSTENEGRAGRALQNTVLVSLRQYF